jgi:hypothetical protein
MIKDRYCIPRFLDEAGLQACRPAGELWVHFLCSCTCQSPIMHLGKEDHIQALCSSACSIINWRSHRSLQSLTTKDSTFRTQSRHKVLHQAPHLLQRAVCWRVELHTRAAHRAMGAALIGHRVCIDSLRPRVPATHQCTYTCETRIHSVGAWHQLTHDRVTPSTIPSCQGLPMSSSCCVPKATTTCFSCRESQAAGSRYGLPTLLPLAPTTVAVEVCAAFMH